MNSFFLKKTKIKRIEHEAENLNSFYFEGSLNAKPGQFIMLYLPGYNERPFSVYNDEKEEFVLTIAKVGKFTEKLFSMKPGDALAYYGPLGKRFEIKGKHIALVGGGYGSAPLSFLAKEALKKGVRSELIIGAKTKSLLLYTEREYAEGITRHYCTDDGSYGFKGSVVEKLKELLSIGRFDMIYTVGPELMMKKVVEISDKFNVDCQLSLERYMKCGIGICGSCSVDPAGIRMCVEGPCISKETAKTITEFGIYHRTSSGKKEFFLK